MQQGADTFWTVAHTADATEKPRLWDKMVGLFPDYANYQKKTDRQIPGNLSGSFSAAGLSVTGGVKMFRPG